MVRLSLPAATAALILAACVRGAPVCNSDEEQDDISNPLGFDESLKEVSIAEDAIVPEFKFVNGTDVFDDADGEDISPLTLFCEDDEDEEELDKRFIVGEDNRHLWNKAAYPFNIVGRLVWSNGVFCSASLVGPRHVLTAKHCLVDGATATFSPGYDNGARFGSAQVTTAVTTGEQDPFTACGTKGDWAVLIINKRLGDQLGYFGARVPNKTQFDKPRFNHIGYPGDKDGGNRPYRQIYTTIHSRRTFDCDSTGPFYTDTDTAGGQSGGPTWEIDDAGNRYVWGALSITVQSSAETYAGWASGNQLVSTIGKLRKEFP